MSLYKKCTAKAYSFLVIIASKAAEILALLSGKIDKYEHMKGEEVLPSNQRQIIELATFGYSLLGKTFQKQANTIDDQGKNISVNRKFFYILYIFFYIKPVSFFIFWDIFVTFTTILLLFFPFRFWKNFDVFCRLSFVVFLYFSDNNELISPWKFLWI